MVKAYLWKTEFPVLAGPCTSRELYNFRIYKNGEHVGEENLKIEVFIKKLLDTVDKEEIYLKPEHINLEPPPNLVSSEDFRHIPLSGTDMKNIFNAWLQF